MIKRYEIVGFRLERELWGFYHAVFADLNSSTPLSQSLDRVMFHVWMSDPRAIKLVARINRKVVGFSVVSSVIEHDPLLSRPYFERHYPGVAVWQFPVIAIAREYRALLSQSLLEAMANEIPENAIATYFYSKDANPGMGRLVGIALARRGILSHEIGCMACVLLSRRS